MKPSKKDIEKVIRIFRPSAPVEDPKMFFGREEQRQLLHRALLAPGRHVALFGQRGVGKTSLLNIIEFDLGNDCGPIIKYTCSHKDSYDDIFRKFLVNTNQLLQQQSSKRKTVRDVGSKLKIPGICEGGASSKLEEETTILPIFSFKPNPDMIATQYCTRPAIFLIDEFDRISDSGTKEMISETIKTLADHCSKTKIVLAGVSNSAIDLMGAHPSTLRNILTLELPHMTAEEIELVINGFHELGIICSPSVRSLIIKAANGLPYFAHLLCEELAMLAIRQERKLIEVDDFFAVLSSALSNINSVVHGSFDAALQAQAQLHIDGYLNLISTPIAIRKVILMAFALTPNNDLNSVGTLIDRLSRDEYVPRKYQSMADFDIKIVLEEICRLSDILIKAGNNVFFRDSFSRGYVWLQAAKKFGKDAIIETLNAN